MAKVTKVSFKAEVKTIELEGKTYDIAPRTGGTEGKLNAWRLDLKNRTDMENFDSLFEILLGTEAKNEIMAEGEDTNLDYLNAIADVIFVLYNEEKDKQEKKKREAGMQELKAITDKTNGLVPLLNATHKL